MITYIIAIAIYVSGIALFLGAFEAVQEWLYRRETRQVADAFHERTSQQLVEIQQRIRK